MLWLLLSPALELGGSFSINPPISPKELFEVTQVTEREVLEPRLSVAEFAVALLDLLAAVTLDMKMSARAQNISVNSFIPSPL